MSAGAPGVLSEEVAAFASEGHSALVGTRDARHVPAVQRALAVRADAASGEVTVLLPVATEDGMLANLRDNGRIAVTLAATDHRSVQIKGRVLEIAAAGAEDRAHLERFRSEMAREWAEFGVPRRITLSLAHWPCHAVRFRAERVFVQTPGPGAGEPLREALEPPTPAGGGTR